ncbi:dTDP-4-dehydrorhamnose reductase [Kroppenstedtia pulmonis]|nr:dTDP-4-dehydrorhamnose reductase [Kroppenstedtia pulmonis]
MMKVLVSGANGQLGRDTVRMLSKDHHVLGYTRQEWDITDRKRTWRLMELEKPDTVIHCAAFTAVDHSEMVPCTAFQVNTRATRDLAEACQQHGVRLIYISTDYVFDGRQDGGYIESDSASPINVYGKTKWMGERWVTSLCHHHLIIRTSWVYGLHGHNFITSVLRQAATGSELYVVDDQVGCPTYTVHLAQLLNILLNRPLRGIIHAAGGGSCSRYEFAAEILQQAGFSTEKLRRISSNQLKGKAVRPAVSILRSCRLPIGKISPLPHWKRGLTQYFLERQGVNQSDQGSCI